MKHRRACDRPTGRDRAGYQCEETHGSCDHPGGYRLHPDGCRRGLCRRIVRVVVDASARMALALGLVMAADLSAAGRIDSRQVARLISSREPGWPQWRGPRRDGICDETGLLQQWPVAGPPLLWEAGGLGRGYSAPIISGDRIYLTGDVGEELRIFALDLAGKQIWAATNGRSWKTPYPGSRAVPALSEGRLYHLNAHGRVACLDAETGREIWGFDVLDRFGGKNNTWAMSECLLVDGPRVMVTVGGPQTLMVALDKKTGEIIWTSKPLRLGPSPDSLHQVLPAPVGEADGPSYASPILFAFGGRRQIVGCSLRHVFGVDAGTGELLWTRPLETRYSVIAATPVLVNDAVFVTAPDTDDGALYRMEPGAPWRIEKVWGTTLDTCHGGLVRVGNALYGSWYRRGKGWVCLDAATGAIRYETNLMAKGSVLYADRRLYCLSEEGDMFLLNPTEERFEVAGRFRLVEGRRTDVWPHPVILDRRLYLRYHETLWCYDLRVR